MRAVVSAVLLAACSSTPHSDYVPGGDALPPRPRAEYRKAVAKERSNERQDALKILDDLALSRPLDLGIHLHRLRLARKLKGSEAAAALYDPPPPGVDPERAAALAALARLPEDDVAARMAVIESATAREPGNPFWRLALADVRLSAHDVVVARAEEERTLGRLQDSAQSYVEAARLAEEARQDAETALQYDPRLAEAHLLLGYLWTRKADLLPQRDRRDELRYVADMHYREALKIDPASVAGRIDLAENLLYFGRYSDAEEELKVALRLAPNEILVWNNLGYTAYATGRSEKAVEYYEQALKLDPKRARVRTALADALRRLDRSDEAVKELARARDDAGDDRALQAAIAFKLAAIFEYDRRFPDAVKEYERYIQLGGPDAAKAKSRIRHIYEGGAG
ncbi:MAG TPA: tetratricopeptide repeat protein [Planctomycetota bacterium]|nr:tetratricopeptide repeat protein [Planctomycetota bacterium]